MANKEDPVGTAQKSAPEVEPRVASPSKSNHCKIACLWKDAHELRFPEIDMMCTIILRGRHLIQERQVEHELDASTNNSRGVRLEDATPNYTYVECQEGCSCA